MAASGQSEYLIVSRTQPNESAAFMELRKSLGTVAEKLQLYKTIGQFVSDVELILTNCTSDNQVRTAVMFQGCSGYTAAPCVPGCRAHRHGQQTQGNVR